MRCRKISSGVISFLIVCLCSLSGAYGDQFAPDEGVYLGVIHDGLLGSDVASFEAAAQKDTSVFGCYVNVREAMQNVGYFNNLFTNWVADVKNAAPNAGILVVMEPKGCFTNFFVNWNPGTPYYDITAGFADTLKRTGIPVFLCFAHEANGSWYDWSPGYTNTDLITTNTYRQAWSNVSILAKSVAPNISMVWSMNAEGDIPRESLYPGDDVVDWVGLSAYNGQEYGNQRNEVVDNALHYKLGSGYWTNYCDFYSIYTDPDGHNKPMMITETGAYAPMAAADSSFPYAASVILAEFNTLTAGLVNVEGIIDDCSTYQPPWGDDSPWGHGTYMTMTNEDGKLIFHSFYIKPGNYDYVDGAMQVLSEDGLDWSSTEKIRLNICRGSTSTSPSPKIILGFRSQNKSNEVDVALYTNLIASTSLSDIYISVDDFATAGNFTWSDVHAFTIQIKSTVNHEAPDDVIIDTISRIYEAPANDQQWSTVQFKNGTVSNDWAAQDSALHVAGIPNGDDELCQSSFTLANNQNWGAYDNLYLRMKKGSGATPYLYLKVNDNLGNEGIREFAVTNSDWQPYVIPVRSLAPNNDFNWDNVSQVTYLIGGNSGSSIELFVDEMSLGIYYPTNIHYETPTEVRYDKENWLYQLYSVDNFSSELRPIAGGLRTNFPHVHMINYFNVSKLESGVQKDFRITADADLLQLYNTLTADEYFLEGIQGEVPDLNVSTESLQIKRGDEGSMTVCLAEAPLMPVTLCIEKTSGDSTISISGGGTQHVFNDSNWSENWELTFATADPEDHANGSAVYSFVCGETQKGTLSVDAVGGYSWHVPANTEPSGYTMRDPLNNMPASQTVSFYNGTYANTYSQNGAVFYYRKPGETVWHSAAMVSSSQSVASGVTSVYWRANIMGDWYAPGDTIEYYMKITYNNCVDTYLGTPDGGASCEFYLSASEARNNLFSYGYASEYIINASAGSHGQISPAGSVAVTEGYNKVFTVTASDLYRIADILVNETSIGVPFANTDTSYQYTWNNVTASGNISAEFTEVITTNNPGNVPETWIESYYPGTTDFEETAESDTDDDALTAWQEYIAGTDPTRAGSTLQTESLFEPGDVDHPVIRWWGTDEPGRLYSIMWKNDLMGSWSELVTDIGSAYPAMNVYTDTIHSAEQINYYRVRVKKND